MLLGYHTNGLAHHSLTGGLELLASIGYRSVALSIDHGWLAPTDEDHLIKTQQAKALLQQHHLGCVVEVEAPFLLDGLIKDGPSLVDPDPTKSSRRADLLRYAIDLAVELNAPCVSFHSGPKPTGLAYSSALEVFESNLREVVGYAEEKNILLALEPRPDMLIDNLGRFERLFHLINSPHLKLTLDIGQLFCLNEVPIANFIERWRDELVNVHICDARVGQNQHLMFGEGQIYFPPIFESLMEINYQHAVHVDLNLHSHDAVRAARQSWAILNPIMEDVREALENA